MHVNSYAVMLLYHKVSEVLRSVSDIIFAMILWDDRLYPCCVAIITLVCSMYMIHLLDTCTTGHVCVPVNIVLFSVS